MQVIKTNTVITKIDLTQNSIGDVGAIHLAAAMEQAAHLERLNLHQNEIGDKGATALLEASFNHYVVHCPHIPQNHHNHSPHLGLYLHGARFCLMKFHCFFQA